ncbi:Gp37 family protein [Roseobacteraceae bacterium NS-SX3]
MGELTARQPEDLTPLERVEAALVALIRERLGEDFYTDAFPESPRAFDGAKYPRLVLVQYMGSRYRDAAGGGTPVQTRQAEFAVHLQLASSGAPVRALARLETLRLAIQGQRIEGKPVLLLRDALAGHDEDAGTWKYILEAGIEIPAVGLPPNQITPALMPGQREGA